MSKKKKKYAKYKMSVPDNIDIRPVVVGGEKRFYIYDATTNTVFDDNQKYGYKSEESAREFFVLKSRGSISETKNSLKKTVKRWCTQNSAVVLNLKDTIYIIGDKYFSDKDCEEFLTRAGININELPFSISDLRKYMRGL